MKSVLRRRSVLVRGIIKTSPDDGHASNESNLMSLTSLLSEQLKRIQHAEGSVIVREGDEDDKTWYLLLNGLVQVELQSNANPDGVVVAAQLRPGSFFGEGTLLTGQPRAATVRAITPVEVLQLTSQDLAFLNKSGDAIMDAIAHKRSLIRLRVLLEQADDCPVVVLAPEEILFKEGEEADAVFIVKSGFVDVLDEEEQSVLLTLKTGDMLGETAMLLRTQRNATAKASKNGNGATLLKVGRRRFMNLIGTQLRAELVASKIASFDRTMTQMMKSAGKK